MSILTVTSTADVINPTDGVVTLREAITAANNNANFGDAIGSGPYGADTIVFNIPGSGVQTIALTSALPVITDTLTIDGTTQPGFAGTPVVELSGAGAGQGVVGLTLSASAAGSTVRGLAINSFSGTGIIVQGDGNTIQGDFIGTDVTGTTALANQTGIQITLLRQHDRRDGGRRPQRHLRQRRDGLDISVVGTTGNLVQGNFIGTNAAGTAALANGGIGIDRLCVGQHDRRDGRRRRQRDLGQRQRRRRHRRRRHGQPGRRATSSAPTSTGTAGARQTATAASIDCVVAATRSAARCRAAPATSSRATTAIGVGIIISGPPRRATWSQGNFIGTDVTGTVALRQRRARRLDRTWPRATRSAAPRPGTGNVISGNGGDGVDIVDRRRATWSQGNFIGTDAAGTAALANGGIGVAIDSASGNTIGGTAAGAGNVISGNAATTVSSSTSPACRQPGRRATSSAPTSPAPLPWATRRRRRPPERRDRQHDRRDGGRRRQRDLGQRRRAASSSSASGATGNLVAGQLHRHRRHRHRRPGQQRRGIIDQPGAAATRSAARWPAPATSSPATSPGHSTSPAPQRPAIWSRATSSAPTSPGPVPSAT